MSSFASKYKILKDNLNKIIPRVSKKSLLSVAGIVWVFPGCLLMWRGIKSIEHFNLGVFICYLLLGILFYIFVFRKIVAKHSQRIKTLTDKRPTIFSFFNGKSYLMMLLMISLGVTLRKTEWIPTQYLTWMYITMAVPLIISSIRFFLFQKIIMSEISTRHFLQTSLNDGFK